MSEVIEGEFWLAINDKRRFAWLFKDGITVLKSF